jgi:cytochrome bd-type quinol oxidase subunit 2
MRRAATRERGARRAALWTLGIGLIASLLVSAAPAAWLQGRLRHGCALVDGSWACDGGDAVLTAVLSSAAAALVSLGLVALIVRATWDQVRLRAERFGVVALIAVLPALALCGWLLVEAIVADAAGVAHDDSRVAMWVERAMLPTIAIGAAGLLAGSGLRMRARGRPSRVAFVTLLLAFAMLLGGAATTALGLLPTGIVAAAAIGAGWHLAAAAWPNASRGSGGYGP